MKQKMGFARAGIISKTVLLRKAAFLCACLLLTLFCWTGGQFVKADTVTGTVPAGSGPNAVAVNPVTNKIYVANQLSNNVTVIDGTNNSTQTVAAGSTPVAVAVNSVTNEIYVANADSNNVTVIDGTNNSTQTVTTGTFPAGIAVNPATNKVYVTNGDSGSVTVIDGTNNSTATVAAGSVPRAVEVNSVTNKIYVANQLSNNVTVIDGTNNSTQTVAAGTFPFAVAVNSVTNKIYIANSDSSNVTVIDGTNNSTQTVAAGSTPDAVAVNSITNKIYVTNFSGNNVTVIDGTNNSTATVAAGLTPVAVAVNSATNKIYVANADSNNVTVIDGINNSTQTLATGTQPNAAAVNSVTNKIYIANLEGNSVTVIDGPPTPTATPTPTPTPGNVCTPSTTVTEGDLFPGGIVSFGVTSGAGSVTVDHVNAGTGLQSLTVIGTPTNAVVTIPAFTPGTFNPVTVTFTPVTAGQAVDFTLRAASTYHAANIRVRCAAVCIPSPTVTEGDLFPGGIVSFGIMSGAGSITVDHVNAGTGLQSLTVVGTPTNAAISIPPFTSGTYNPVTITYSIIDPNLPVDFTLRAASTYHGIFIRVRCTSAVNTFSGRATSVNATHAGVNVILADTGQLPPEGGSITRSVASANVLGGTLTTGLLTAITQGAGEQSRSQAQVENLNLLVGGNTITSDLVPASSQCTCTTGGPVCDGGVMIANLRLNGVVITNNVDINNMIALPGGGFIITNEQIRTGAGNTAGITVNGVHVIIPGAADDIISSAHSDIVCMAQ